MKFGRKLMYLNYLHQLAQHIPLNQLIIPPAVRKSVDLLTTRIKRIFSRFFIISLATVQLVSKVHLHVGAFLISNQGVHCSWYGWWHRKQ